jgi:putative FmdB family regulatory protein
VPLFRYTCESCSVESEVLIRGSETPACPECGSTKLHKEASAFAVSTASTPASAPTPPCGMPQGCCGGGACGMN